MTHKLENGKSYHIFNRGVNGAPIFFEERNYEYFLRLYKKQVTPVADTFAFCLLKNHFHFVLKIKEASTIAEAPGAEVLQIDPSQQFSNFFNGYSKSINKAYGRTGALFERAFERIEVPSERYFYQLILYIHLNPQKHGVVKDYQTYPHSSYNAFLSDQPTFLQRGSVLELFGSWEGFRRAHTLYKEDLELLKFIGNDRFKSTQ